MCSLNFCLTCLVAMSKPATRATLKRPSAALEEEAPEEDGHEDDKEEESEESKEKEKVEAEEKDEEDQKTPSATAKAKAKSKAKSKAKAKAKGRAKAGSKQNKNREKKGKDQKKERKENKDKKEKKDDEEAPRKENLNDKCEKWKAAVGEPENNQNSEDASEENATRERGKSRKFQKLKDAGSIPDHILAMFEHESKKQDKPRAYKTALINRLFKSDGKGGYVMQAKDPWLQQQKEIMHSKYGKDEQVGSPKDVFLYSTFHGNQEALQSAIDKGSVQEWNQDGAVYCGFRQTKSGVKSAKVDKTSMGSGEVNLQQNQWAALTKAFKTMSWSFANTDELVTFSCFKLKCQTKAIGECWPYRCNEDHFDRSKTSSGEAPWHCNEVAQQMYFSG